ncbi:MAG TPA: cysteine--tRNA ligase [Acidimicrobiales bacterium]|nr:cysteine--tRNA ligase [Acidimicrobiales bacterium]
MLRLHDTGTMSVRPLELRDEGRVSMYVCGPTVYDLPHIGHGRFTLVFDVLRRYLKFRGLDVRYVSNVTDIDDHIIQRAAAEGRSEPEVAAEFEAQWWSAMDSLGVLRPDHTPHATEYVNGMIDVIGQLLGSGAAYPTSDGIYLDTSEVSGYGLLAHQPLESLRSGARIEANEEKRSPLDFVLWKGAKPGEPTWDAPWGAGRPGWHTECVVMSLDLLGEGFDLHGGAIDLIFPHHENERAQAVALGRSFARHWVHNGWVEVEGEKMSKSLGNFTSLTDLLARTDARAYRLLVLRSHYRSPIEVTPETIADAEEALARLDSLARRFELDSELSGVTLEAAEAAGADPRVLGEFLELMDDDLDTPAALAAVFETVRRANALADAGEDVDARALAVTVAVLCGAMGLTLRGGDTDVDPQTAAIVAERDAARSAGDWGRADAIRDELQRAGWVVEDSPRGTRLHR